MSYHLVRTIDPQARELRIEIPEILWSAYGPFERMGPHEIERGPWTFVAPL